MRHDAFRFRRSSYLLLSAFLSAWTLLQGAASVQATVYTWDTVAGGGVTGGSGTWNTSNTNWTTNGGATNVSWPASGTDNDATFSGTAGTVTIAAGGVTANDVTFSSTGYSIQGAVLTLNGATPTLTAPAAATTAAISSEIAGSSGLRLTRSGSNASVTNFVATLSGANSYTGTTVVQGLGTVSGQINLTLNTAAANGTTVVAVPGDLTLNSVSGTANSSAWVNLAANNQVAFSSTVNFSGTSFAFAQIFLNNNHQTFAAINDTSSFGSIANNNNGVGGGTSISTLTINGATTSNYNGYLRNNAGGGSGQLALVKDGTGTLNLTGATGRTVYTGGTTIRGGVLSLSSSVMADTAFSAGNPITFDTGGAGAATLQWNGVNTVDLSSKIKINDGAAARIDTNGNNVTFASALQLGTLKTGSLTKVGAGTLTLSAVNTYTGATTINAGTLTVNADGAISASSPVTVNSGGTLRVTSVRGINTGGTLTVNDGGTVFINNNATNVRLDLATVNMTGGSITGAANVNVFSGLAGTTASGLTFNIFANAAPSTIDTIRLQTNQNPSGAGLMTFNVASGGQANVSSIIYDGAQGVATALTKSGGGVLQLTGDNTYSGVTTVSAGTLLANNTSGSATGTSAVNVNGGVFGGTGAVSGAITVNSGGTLAPGASIQTIAGGALTFNNNSTFAYELDSAALLSAAGDLQLANGALTLNGVVNLTLTDLSPSFSNLLPINTTLTLINFSGLWNGGLFSLGGNELSDGEIFAAGKYFWQIDYDALGDGANFASEQIYNNHVNITLLALTVPEPSTWGLALCGFALLARRLQRKRKVQA